jgi:hypothetical protein
LKYIPKERVIHVFQAPFAIQEHREEKKSKGQMLLANLGKFSTPKSMNS